MLAAPNIENATRCIRHFQRQPATLCNVVNANEIALLIAVFENQRGVVVQQARSENRQHSSIRIRKRLPRAVNIEEPQCYSRNSVSPADEQTHLFLVKLRKRVNGSQRWRFALWCRNGLENVAMLVSQLPLAGFQLGERSLSALDQFAFGAAIQPLTIKAH